ncbi:hypothetical protein [Streptomyces sp. C8S0]|uniref:hypothetical protein n=1 Tax=Streptomyces sp. C8S0 TaxID=2585716 RepID=UPI001865AF39|nr:hypothetical protein [Streptomyces sp. C8S0]
MWGGYNDSGGDQGAIGAAAELLYTQLLGEVAPGGEVYVIGCWSPPARRQRR